MSQLILLAQIVDDDFQRSIQDMFGIDPMKNEGVIPFDDNGENNEESKKKEVKHGDGKIKYLRFGRYI